MDDSVNGSGGVPADGGGAGGDSGADVRSTLVALMVASEGGFRQRAAARLAKLPGYCAVPADQLARVLDEMTWVYRTFLGCLSQRRELLPSELAHLEAIGQSRARHLIPVAEMNSAFRTVLDDALIMLEDHARCVAGDDLDAFGVVSEIHRTLTGFALQAFAAMNHGHAHPDAHGDESVGDVWLRDMLSAPLYRVTGEDDRGLPDLVIVLPSGSGTDLPAVLHEFTTAFGTVLAGPGVSAPVQHGIALVDHGLDRMRAARRYAEIAHRHHAVVIHSPVQHPGHAAECYRVTRPHLGAVGRALAKSGAVALDDVMLLAMLSAAPNDVVEVFIWQLLGPLLAESCDDQLFRTLEVYAATDGMIDQTVRILGVTPKTLRARLDRIFQTIGRPVQRGDNLQTARAALALLRIHGDTWPPAGDPRWQADPSMR